jgi:hypothetical protein
LSGRELRFGVTLAERRSQYWEVRASAKRSDIYLASERTGAFIHVSVHDPAYGLHVVARTPAGEQTVAIPHPVAVLPGVVRLVELRLPQAVVSYTDMTRKRVMWIERPDAQHVWVAFEVLAEAAGAASREAEWSRGCVIVGRVPRVDGGSVVVAGWLMTGQDGRFTFNTGTKEEADAVRAHVRGSEHRLLVNGTNPDGSIWFLELTNVAPS